MRPALLGKLVWLSIYGGLLSLGLGLAVRGSDVMLGTGISIGGAVLAGLGFAGIVVRARMKDNQ